MASPSAFVPLAGRLALAAIFIVSGLQKAALPEGAMAQMVAAGIPAAFYWPIIGLEVLVGLMVAVGYGTRVAALLLMVFTMATAFIYHANFADPNELNHFLKNIALSGGLIYIVGYGPGPLALHRLRSLPRPNTRFTDLTELGRPHGTLMH